jgi:LCP family protein required for cell wall assembly
MPTPDRGHLARVVARTVSGVVAGCIALLVLVVSGTGYAVLARSDAGITRVDALPVGGSRPPPSAAGSTTFLLVGSDARTGMSAADRMRLHVGSVETAAGRRADTMLLVHVSATRDAVTVVSLPRDSYVTIPAHTGTDGSAVPQRRNKLNAAYAVGGPRLAVATVEASTGVRVDHYIEVDFLGFERLVDSVGGVDVCAPKPLFDRKAGLRLPAGVTRVDGRTGLAYVRARSLDARADLGRIERQQQFLAAMLSRVTSREVLLDPRALVAFLDAALAAVRVDRQFSRAELIRLATRLRHVSGHDVTFLTVPVADPSYRSGTVGAVALWDEQASAALFAQLRADAPPAAVSRAVATALTVAPAQIRVRVYNGSGVSGLGAKAARDLTARGYDVAGRAATWPKAPGAATVIRYDARYTETVKTLSAAFPGARLENVTGLGHTQEVVIGSGYTGVRAVLVKETVPQTASATGHGASTATSAGPC